MEAELEVRDVTAGYGGGTVLDGIDLTVGRGERVAVLGRNGVGKTTLLKTVMGLLSPKSGTIRHRGVRVDGEPPFRVARRGIGYVPQGRDVFADLTVEENLILGDLGARSLDLAFDSFPALRERRRATAGRLSGGQQQLLAIARALMAEPSLLLLDEPSEGIQPSVVDDIARTLSDIVGRRGMALVLVEQNVDLALRMTDRVVFMEHGRVVAEGGAAALRADPTPIDVHVGL